MNLRALGVALLDHARVVLEDGEPPRDLAVGGIAAAVRGNKRLERGLLCVVRCAWEQQSLKRDGSCVWIERDFGREGEYNCGRGMERAQGWGQLPRDDVVL